MGTTTFGCFSLLMLLLPCRGFLRSHRKPSGWTVVSSWNRNEKALPLPASTTAVDDEQRKVPAKFINFPFEYHEMIEMEVESLISRGWGMGRVDISDRIQGNNHPSHDDEEHPNKKWIVMVPSVIPNEIVRVRIFRNFAKYSEADLIEVVQPSASRVEPVCKLAGDCGGCQLQHMEISAQRDWKTLIVNEALAQYDVILPEGVSVQPTLGTDEIYHYRSKLTPHYNVPSSSRKKNLQQQNLPLIQSVGFQKKSSRQTLDVDHCCIATPAVNEAYKAARETLLQDTTTDRKKGATLLFRQANPDDKDVTVNHTEYLTTSVNGLQFTYQAGNFFQNNYYVLPLMVEHILAQATRPIEGTAKAPTHLVDCYCGSGLFAVSAAHRFEQVVGIEINQKAIEEATANAKQNGVVNCSFQAASAEHIFDNLTTGFPVHQTAVVLDPPRKGCSDEFLRQLFIFGPQRIVYMSCDPVTQARDAADILMTGDYQLTFVQPFDLFPQTRHIESLMIFERQS